MRWRSLLLAVVASFALAAHARAEAGWPAVEWQAAPPATAGWSTEKLAEAESFARSYAPTAIVIVQDAKVIAAWGDDKRKANVRSVRKSLLSALYGIAVVEGRIDLGRTIGDLGIDDRPPRLTESEKQATVRHLLMSRSGIYHPAAYETRDMAAKRPARGSHPPGRFWYYNNWDFNALGTIYKQRVGKDVFQSFDERIARPLAMQDFAAADGRFVFDRTSDHPAYTIWMTARDLARVGWLYLKRGTWSGMQIIPEDWIDESTSALSDAGEGWGYGYMWWTISTDMVRNQPQLRGAYLAFGTGGQALAVIPSLRMVVAQVTDVAEGKERIEGAAFRRLLILIVAAAAH